jgi:hypothetical protein
MKLPSRRASPLSAETTALRAVVRTPDWFWSALSIILLACLAAYFFLTSPTDGDFWWFDSSRHAMNGVFLLDLLRELHRMAACAIRCNSRAITINNIWPSTWAFIRRFSI